MGTTIWGGLAWGGDNCFGVGLCMPWRGFFMYPLAVAGLGFRYFNMASGDMYGHPLRKPFLVALRSFDIFGLPSAWWANRTFSALYLIECVKDAEWAVSAIDGGRVAWAFTLCFSCLYVGCCWMACIGSVHKSVVLSLNPVIMHLLL